MIRQGDIYWVESREPMGPEPGYRRPYMILQNDHYNDSRISTVLGCALTTNLRRADAPSNVLLAPGEANLAEQSVIVTSQTATVSKDLLGDYIGTLSPARIRQVISGLRLLITPRPVQEKPTPDPLD